MRVIIIEDKDAKALLDQLELAKYTEGEDVKLSPLPRTVEDVHRHFHYVVCRWLQDQGCTVLRLFWLVFLLPALALAADRPAYNRESWPHWRDMDRNGCDTRQDVLRTESLIEPEIAEDGCTVLSGRWFCIFTGKVFTDPKKLDVDHLVALGEAHTLGGWKWKSWRKAAYSNDRDDPHHLVAVEARANRAKGSRGVDQWLPPLALTNPRDACSYVMRRRAVRERWGLNKVSRAEQQAEEKVLRACR